MFTLVLLGPPGAGKGTQAVRICDSFGFVHISTGDMLREEIGKKSDIGVIAADCLHRGELVPNELIIDMAVRKLESLKEERGVVLDGFPRTLEQAETLSRLSEINMAISIAVERGVLLDRVCSRRTCIHCKATFNASEVNGVCRRCGHKLYIRDDDRPETFYARYSVYEERTLPIIEYYRKKGLLSEVDGNAAADDVFNKIAKVLSEGCGGNTDDKH